MGHIPFSLKAYFLNVQEKVIFITYNIALIAAHMLKDYENLANIHCNMFQTNLEMTQTTFHNFSPSLTHCLQFLYFSTQF